MKTLFKIFFSILLLAYLGSCKKDVVPPNDDVENINRVYIKVADKEYLFLDHKKLLVAKSQKARFTNGMFNGLPRFRLIENSDTTLEGYKKYDFNIQLDSDKEGLFFGGLDLYFWFKDPQSPIYLSRFTNKKMHPVPSKNFSNDWITIINYNFFKINGIETIKGYRYVNFEASFQFTDHETPAQIYNAYWKGNIRVEDI